MSSSLRTTTALVDRLADAGLVVGPAALPDAVAAALISGGVSSDSRTIEPGAVFVAIRGAAADGHRFVGEAARRGAVVALVEAPVDDAAIAQVIVTAGRRVLAEAAAWWNGDPSLGLGVIGITGTDGKTTTATLAAAGLEAAGLRTGLLSTVTTRIGGREVPNAVHVTTPEAVTVQASLRAMVEAGDTAAVLETTSHGLALDRVAAVAYDLAVLTNLTSEHLELHGSLAAYRDAKLSLFERLGAAGPKTIPGAADWRPAGVVNADDPSAPDFEAATRRAGARLIRYGAAVGSDVRLSSIIEEPMGLAVAFDAPSGRGEVRLRLAGRFNAANALAAVAIGEALGLDRERVAAGIGSIAGVPGRMVAIEAGQPFEVIVDFAHTAAALAAVLDAVRPRVVDRGGALIAVFGSAGERDRAKRPAMGRVAAERCRLVVLADEDPRGEDPGSILAEIAAGAATAGARLGRDVLLVPDRRAAIRAAFAAARPGDLVLLAGKGHETAIETAGGPIAWDEIAEARVALVELGLAEG